MSENKLFNGIIRVRFSQIPLNQQESHVTSEINLSHNKLKDTVVFDPEKK